MIPRLNFYLTHKHTFSIKKINKKAIVRINLTIDTTDVVEKKPECMQTICIRLKNLKDPSLQDFKKFMIL